MFDVYFYSGYIGILGKIWEEEKEVLKVIWMNGIV